MCFVNLNYNELCHKLRHSKNCFDSKRHAYKELEGSYSNQLIWPVPINTSDWFLTNKNLSLSFL